MYRTKLPWILCLLLALTAVGAKDTMRLADYWVNRDVERTQLRKIAVVGVTEQRDARNHFEDKFVSQLRGRGIEGVASYTLAPDLTDTEAEDTIRSEIEKQGIEAVIAVRLVPLKDLGEDGWIEAWTGQIASDKKLGEWIDEWLPVPETSSSKYGVEISLWRTGNGALLWAGRSESVTAKQVRKGRSSSLIQAVFNQMKLDRLI